MIYSELLRGVTWFEIDVSVLHIGSIFKVKVFKKKYRLLEKDSSPRGKIVTYLHIPKSLKVCKVHEYIK